MKIKYSKNVKQALGAGYPVLALESTIIAHGMPFPQNLNFAKRAERLCKELGVVPATIAILGGDTCVGLTDVQLENLAKDPSFKKVSRRELGQAIAGSWNGATTVSSTMHIAYRSGISVFSTGGIGGVHRGGELSFDISQDLKSLAEIPMVVISAGAKAILDLPKTVELLETLGVSVLGYKVDEFPAFYSRDSGCLGLDVAKSASSIAEIHNARLLADLQTALLIANPVPFADEIPSHEINNIIKSACEAAERAEIKGKDLTPFLLKKLVKKTNGRSLDTNISLALNNVELGAKVADKLSKL